MTLMNAPKFDPAREKPQPQLAHRCGSSGCIDGTDWPRRNHRRATAGSSPTCARSIGVSTFFDALEAKDYNKAYAIWNNDADWQQHPQKYDYTLKRFHRGLGHSGSYPGACELVSCRHLEDRRLRHLRHRHHRPPCASTATTRSSCTTSKRTERWSGRPRICSNTNPHGI